MSDLFPELSKGVRIMQTKFQMTRPPYAFHDRYFTVPLSYAFNFTTAENNLKKINTSFGFTGEKCRIFGPNIRESSVIP